MKAHHKLAAVIGMLIFISSSPGRAEPTGISYGGGTLIQHPRLFISYWNFPGDDPANYRPTLEGLLNHIGKSKYLATTTIYSAGSYNISNDLQTADLSSPIPTWDDGTPWPTNSPNDPHPNQDDIAAAVTRAVSHFDATGADDIIVLATGWNRVYWPGGCAYHSDISNPVGGLSYPFLDIPYPADTLQPARWPNGVCSSSSGGVGQCVTSSDCYPVGTCVGGTCVSETPSDITSVVTYHELAECITDPRPNSQNGWNGPNGEIGDINERFIWRYLWLDGENLYPIQALWDIRANNGQEPTGVFADKAYAGNDWPVLQQYWNRSGTPTGITWGEGNGLITATSVYSLTDNLEFTGGVGAAYETPNFVDVVFSDMPNYNEMLLIQDPATYLLALGVPDGQSWIETGSPDAATMGWDIVDVFGTATQASTNDCRLPSDCAVFHTSRDSVDWTYAWDQLPVLVSGVKSGVGAVSDVPGHVSVAVVDLNGDVELSEGLRTIPPTVGIFQYQPWTDLGAPPFVGVGDPDLSSTAPGQISIWITSSAGELWQCDTSTQSWPPPRCAWLDRGAPISSATGQPDPLAPSPSAVSQGDETVYVDVQSQDGTAYSGGIFYNQPFSWGVAGYVYRNASDSGQDDVCW